MGDVDVMEFFCLSGYLITANFDRSPNLLTIWPNLLYTIKCAGFVHLLPVWYLPLYF